MLATQSNIGFGCADCRCFAFGRKGPYYPDRPHVEATGYYAPAHEWNAAAANPPGKRRAVCFMSQQYNGWVLRRIQAGVAGRNNIYGLAEGTQAPKGQLRPEHYLAYLAGPPRNPGARPQLNNVPGVLPCQWIIVAESGAWAREKDPHKTIENWKKAFEDLGAQGIGAVPAEPYGWETQISPASPVPAPRPGPSARRPRMAPPPGPTEEEKAAARAAAAGLRDVIVKGAAAGRNETVYVDLTGGTARATILAADEDGLDVQAGNIRTTIKWSQLSTRRFLGVAKRYTDDESLLTAYAKGNGLEVE
jgi:hypothetical protein